MYLFADLFYLDFGEGSINFSREFDVQHFPPVCSIEGNLPCIRSSLVIGLPLEFGKSIKLNADVTGASVV